MSKNVNGKGEPVAQVRLDLARNLQKELKRRQISDKQIAEKVDLSERQVRDMKTAAHDPRLSNVDKVSGFLGLSVGQLLSSDADDKAFRLWSTYRTTSDGGRKLIDLAVNSAQDDTPDQGASNDDLGETKTRPPVGRRNPTD